MFTSTKTYLTGQLLLTKPKTNKRTSTASNDLFDVCVTSMQGWRVTMEDTSCLLLDLPSEESSKTSLIGVFDGHGGVTAADYVAKNFYKFLIKQPEYKDNVKKAITKSFMEIDAKMRHDMKDDSSGCTALVVLLRDKVLYCSNIGDSRAIAYENNRVTDLSHDHKPTDPPEYKRIVDAGGWVEAERVNGSLALSRALGDYQFKSSTLRQDQQMVSCVPDIVTKKLDDKWKFVLMACDGIWEVMSSEKAGDFVRHRLDEGMSIEKVCESLMMACLAPRPGGSFLGCDNMTVALILFKWPK